MTMQKVKVWDWPVRLCHWGMVLALLGSYLTGRYGWLSMDWHFRFGYALLVLLLFRLLWGVVGPANARFTGFVAGPLAVFRHLGGLLHRQPSGWLGHNPLGSWSALVLLSLLTAQAVTGLFASDDIINFGPLSALVASATVRQMTRWHGLIQNWLLVFVAIHLLAIAFYELYKRERLLLPMFSGRKPAPAASAVDDPPRPWWLSWLLFGACVGAVWGLVAWGYAQRGW